MILRGIDVLEEGLQWEWTKVIFDMSLSEEYYFGEGIVVVDDMV